MLPSFSSTATLMKMGSASSSSAARLVEKTGNGGDAGKNVAYPHILGRIVIGEGLEERRAKQLDIDGRVVPVVLDAVIFEQGLRDLVVDEAPVGGVFGSQRGERGFGVKPLPPLLI